MESENKYLALQFEVINRQLAEINNKIDKQNGKLVVALREVEEVKRSMIMHQNNHPLQCDVEKLQHQAVATEAIKKYFRSAIFVLSTLLITLSTIITLFI